MSMNTLYIRDGKGAVRQWSISADYAAGTLLMEYGQLGGSIQSKAEYVPFGKVNRTRKEQMDLQMAARIKKRIQQGYSVDIEDAENKPTNILRLPKPMKAHKFKPGKADYKNAFVQRKYDGNRCMITNRGGEIIAYSSVGKTVTAIHHIIQDIVIPDGWVVDGELYCHGVKLQTLVSWIKREQEDTKRLEFRFYDLVDDAPFTERLRMLEDVSGTYAHLAPTVKVRDELEAVNHFEESRAEGYEGSMLRWGDAGYEDGKRAYQILKLKAWDDDEFKVLNVEPSKDGWGILVLAKDGKLFKTPAPGTMDEKFDTMENKDNYIGRLVTVEYAYLTSDGIPFHPVAKAWRS